MNSSHYHNCHFLTGKGWCFNSRPHLPGCKVETNSSEAVTACVSRRAWPATKAWDCIVTRYGNVARVGQVALVKVRAPGAVSGEALWTRSTPKVGRAVEIKALYTLEDGR